MTVASAYLAPFASVALSLVPVLAVAIALPAAPARSLYLLVAACAAAEAVAVVAGHDFTRHAAMTGPSGLQDLLAVSAAFAAAVLVLLMLVVDTARLRLAVEAAREGERRSRALFDSAVNGMVVIAGD